MKLAFKIALRFLKSSKGQTLLITLGIAIGVAVQVFIGSLIQGLQKDLINTTIGNTSQITIQSQKSDKTIENWESIMNEINKKDNEITVVSPTVSLPGFIDFNDKTESIVLRGFGLQQADLIYQISDSMIAGEKPLKENQIIIGKQLKNELGVNKGEKVNIITPQGKAQALTVAGFFDLKVTNINKSWIITNISTAQNVFDIDNRITALEMQIFDVFEADQIANEIQEKINMKDLTITNWKEENEQLLSGLQGQSVSSIMIQVFVLVAVVLGIASVLAISVLQKSRQLGILKAMGVKDRTASLVFLFQGFILGIMGGILGIALGMLLLYSFTVFAVNPDGTPVVAIYINYKFIALSAIIAIFSATIAALIPAIKSSKLSPMEVIKNG
ncbi:ABC transporter permease [Serpentinicella sp. ANB-PHB4]|uniref:ABC transporter permease n=1 Tax=Serpentinicella sp. ANB-PHB4 TaxID=3074076 RepID=UPI00285D2433|nr:ABC transporter permease [Serpentinicella sp. ANB-PHB4]MDR5658476.1 ABC transporter permease [Serpentinicella sp. ANB-PHB4]